MMGLDGARGFLASAVCVDLRDGACLTRAAMRTDTSDTKTHTPRPVSPGASAPGSPRRSPDASPRFLISVAAVAPDSLRACSTAASSSATGRAPARSEM